MLIIIAWSLKDLKLDIIIVYWEAIEGSIVK